MTMHWLIYLASTCLVYRAYGQGGFEEEWTTESQYFDVFNTDFPEWRIAFRGQAEVNQSVYSAYMRPQVTQVDKACRQLPAVGQTCSSHYRNNDVLDHWDNIKEVAFVVYKGEQQVAFVIFDGVGSNYTSWFSEIKLLNSSWTDIKVDYTEHHANQFSISGYRGWRRFYINEHFFGCPNDAGWFVAMDTFNEPCKTVWTGADTPSWPRFLYATTPTFQNWEKGDIDVADSIFVFVKYGASTAIGK